MICRRARLRAGPGEYGSSFVGGGESWSVRGVCGADTLLGPEGSGPTCVLRACTGGRWCRAFWSAGALGAVRTRVVQLLLGGVCGGSVCLGLAWSCVENCTVDASIFVYQRFYESLVSAYFVVKFLRAQGGCLGTRSR